MAKILVTGGAGFIGSFLVDKLIEDGQEVIVYDNLDKQVHIDGKKPDYLNPKAKFILGDVLDYEKLKKVVTDCDYIFHFASKVGVGQSQYEIKKYVDVNVGGTANLLNILVNEKNKVKKLIVAGSMSSYGEGLYNCKNCGNVRPQLRSEKQLSEKDWELNCPKCNSKIKPIPTPETAVFNCNSIYALTKKEQEEMSLIIGKTYSIPTTVLRFFNVYGPRQSLSNPYTGVAAIFMSRIKNDKRPVVFEDGLQTRDFVYAEDVANACVLALKKEKANYNVYNVGTGNPITIKTIAEKIAKLYNKDIKPEITNKFRKGDVRHCFADISKIKKELGFEPKFSFEEGMKKLIEWAKTAKAVDMYEKAQKELEEKKLV
ncbi:MAG: SDR family NAD(P)-dependent oxidoreductase [Endomicrobiia bacterium]